MSWPLLHGVTTIARDSAQSERWDLSDDWPWWHGDLGELFDDMYSKRSVWDLGIEGSVSGYLT